VSAEQVLTGQHFMNGDHACAEGAIAAGCRFFGGYPITPSTEIAERLARRMPEVDGVYLQMEDELGSMSAILGASAGGARSMTATSGPGLSLMLENLGLGVMLELPCVVVDVQRGSPSTGLPTMPGQSDVMQVRWGSHGDFQIVAYAPWSPQEMFDLTILAFNAADRLRVPVVLLADEVVGHMVERVVIPAAEQIEHWDRKQPQVPPNGHFDPFQAQDDDLVPPMVHAGDGYRIHYTGLTHDEHGYPDMTADTHQALVSRLIEKVHRNASSIMRYEEYYLEDAQIIVISYGCTARSARQAVREAREMGVKAGLFRLITLWPFPEEKLSSLSAGAGSFVVAELNLGQIRSEVERIVQRNVIGVHHAGGAMITPETILTEIIGAE
jgi:2-oxoglutarate ferredoxin oxidoreductase subunit alpha